MVRKLERLSASGLKKYQDCPKQFYLYYLSNVPEPEEGVIEHFEVGNAVHDSIENVLKTRPELIDDEEELFNAFVKEEDTLGYEYSDDEKVLNCFETASRWISSFVVDVNHVEEEWIMEKDGMKWKGFADLVANIEMNDVTYENVIVDWKTGKETEEWKEVIQSGMYIEMFWDKFGSYPEGAVFVYLDEETQSFHPRISDGEVFWNEHENKYWTEIDRIKSKIMLSEQNNNWQADPESKKCFFCDHKLFCQDSPVGAENVNQSHISIGGSI